MNTLPLLISSTPCHCRAWRRNQPQTEESSSQHYFLKNPPGAYKATLLSECNRALKIFTGSWAEWHIWYLGQRISPWEASVPVFTSQNNTHLSSHGGNGHSQVRQNSMGTGITFHKIITEWSGLNRTFQEHSIPHPCRGSGHLPGCSCLISLPRT